MIKDNAMFGLITFKKAKGLMLGLILSYTPKKVISSKQNFGRT